MKARALNLAFYKTRDYRIDSGKDDFCCDVIENVKMFQLLKNFLLLFEVDERRWRCQSIVTISRFRSQSYKIYLVLKKDESILECLVLPELKRNNMLV